MLLLVHPSHEVRLHLLLNRGNLWTEATCSHLWCTHVCTSHHIWIKLPWLRDLSLLLRWHLTKLIHIDCHVHPSKHVGLGSLWDTLRGTWHHEATWSHGSLLHLSERVDETTWLLLVLLECLLLIEGVKGLILVWHLDTSLWLLEPWVLIVQAH